MSRDKMQGQNSVSQTLRIGGSAHLVNQVLGDNGSISVTNAENRNVPADVSTALCKMQVALAKSAPATALVDAAIQEIKAEKPNRANIGEYLRSSLEVAKATVGMADVVRQLAPEIRTVSTWVGDIWSRVT